MTTRNFQNSQTLRLTQNASVVGSIRREQFEGREHLVIPVVALVEGVVNGALAPADEILASLPAWNGVPVTVNHPAVSGVPISANSPAVLEKQSIGRAFNFSFAENKLKGEMWIDTAKATALGGKALEVLQRAELGQPLEVSTGYFTNYEESEGLFNGKQYKGIQRNMRPNHLAALPDDVGACSWTDGCGAPRVNSAQKNQDSEGSGVMSKLATAFSGLAALMGLTVNITNDDIRAAIRARLAEETPNIYPYVEDVMPDAFVYESNRQLFRRSFTIDAAGKVTLGSEASPVQRNTTYVTLQKQTDKTEENTVDKTAKINALIACNCTHWTEADRPTLESLSEGVLDKLGVTPETISAVTANKAQTATQTAPSIPEGHVVINAGEKAILDKALADAAGEKTALVEKITANSKLPKEYLETQDIEILKALGASVIPATNAGNVQVVNFAGQAGTVATNAQGGLGPAPAICLEPVK